MKKIISHVIQIQKSPRLDELCADLNLTIDQVQTICSINSDVFVFEKFDSEWQEFTFERSMIKTMKEIKEYEIKRIDDDSSGIYIDMNRVSAADFVKIQDKCYKPVLKRESVFHYKPPFNIVNKTSFNHAIQTSFPKGIRKSSLNFCYPFAISDLNEIKYDNKVFIMKYGKTDDEIIFKQSNKNGSLADIWNQYFDPHMKFARVVSSNS